MCSMCLFWVFYGLIDVKNCIFQNLSRLIYFFIYCWFLPLQRVTSYAPTIKKAVFTFGTCALCPRQRLLVMPCQNAAVVFRARVQLHITWQLDLNIHNKILMIYVNNYLNHHGYLSGILESVKERHFDTCNAFWMWLTTQTFFIMKKIYEIDLQIISKNSRTHFIVWCCKPQCSGNSKSLLTVGFLLKCRLS